MSAIIGVDDTDSRSHGMCTTYVGTLLAERLRAAGYTVNRLVLVRLCPAVAHKTRGNAAVAVHTTAPPEVAFDYATTLVSDNAVLHDSGTNPGVVVASHGPTDIPGQVAAIAGDAVQTVVERDRVDRILERVGYHVRGFDAGRGLIGATAAIGAWRAQTDWTYEHLTYRPSHRWGEPRTVDESSVFQAAAGAYPTVWDTVDRTAGEVVCVPHTPGPVLYGIRGNTAPAVRRVSDVIDAEPIARAQTFITNQGTDAHLQSVSLAATTDGQSVRTTGTVTTAPWTTEGGHVFLELGAAGATRTAAAFEPTKRFRDHVRCLDTGDRVTVCGEVSDGTIKLEKFAVRSLDRTTAVVPACPECGRSMESAGADQGYRCRRCTTSTPSRVTHHRGRSLTAGWYEVPPVARRHIAKPLVRGGFDAPIHPER